VKQDKGFRALAGGGIPVCGEDEVETLFSRQAIEIGDKLPFLGHQEVLRGKEREELGL